MAIATSNTTQPKSPVVNAVSLDYQSITDAVDTQKVKCISKLIEGSPLTLIAYYAQRVGSDDELRYQDQHLSPTYQSYVKIHNLVLNVIDATSFSIDSSTTQATGEGTALVASFMKFNKGDMFTANLLNGEPTLLRVTESTLTSVYKGSPYQIRYTVVGPVSNNTANLLDLDAKTYKEYWYNPELLSSCSGPLLADEDQEAYTNVQTSYGKLIEAYIRLFLDRDTDSFVLNLTEGKFHDPMLNNYLIKVLPLRYQVRRGVRGFNTHDVDFFTIWDLLIDKDLGLFSDPKRDFRLASKGSQTGHNSTMYLEYTALDFWVDSEGTELMLPYFTGSTYTGEIEVEGNLKPLLPDLYTESYVLPETYYSGTYNSVFETLIHSYLLREELDRTQLNQIIASFKNWSLFEKYYYGAILITLLKYAGNQGC